MHKFPSAYNLAAFDFPAYGMEPASFQGVSTEKKSRVSNGSEKVGFLYKPLERKLSIAPIEFELSMGLQLACMKPESLVIAGQPYGGEFVPGPCTHRPSHYGSWPCPKFVDYSNKCSNSRNGGIL
ncbi:hypothetical protein V6N12_045839 [Hibiscus sabdariffa]|uniref:Uncharacterized protein n=1 Tax=Hibiscus sabdariffa TaxID=183260 RepID=A0ABR2G3Y9_9ROSI